MRDFLKASESVTEGHPDVVCNKIAGAILDEAIVASAPKGMKPKVAIEVSVKGTVEGGTVLLFGEVTLPVGIALDYESIARKVIASIGYTDETAGFSHKLSECIVRITQQSADIASGVNQKRTGAGDQGMMFGGAVAGEGMEYMPLPIMLAHALTTGYTNLYKTKGIEYLRPDGKAQVVVAYHDGIPVRVAHVTLAASHDPSVAIEQVREDLFEKLIKPVLTVNSYSIQPTTELVINGGGPWTVYGPLADAGTTNRKIVVDSYGGAFPHGGGGFNGKDATKVDVSGAVGARYLAKTLVANNLARKVQVDVCYALGKPDSLGLTVETFGTAKYRQNTIEKKARNILDLSVDGILRTIDMQQPLYTKAAVGGWFGRAEFPWEKVPML